VISFVELLKINNAIIPKPKRSKKNSSNKISKIITAICDLRLP